MTGRSIAKKTALLGIMAALIIAGKAALTAVANVEVVSLFCALFGYVFGPIAIIPTCVFILVEAVFWSSISYPSWIVAYVIHFNLIVIVFWLLSKVRLRTPIVFTAVIAFMTFCFGVIEAFFAVIPVSTDYSNFIWRFGIYYGRGVPFCVVHIVSNTAIFFILFYPLKELLIRLKQKMLL